MSAAVAALAGLDAQPERLQVGLERVHGVGGVGGVDRGHVAGGHHEVDGATHPLAKSLRRPRVVIWNPTPRNFQSAPSVQRMSPRSRRISSASL
ncbi:MAG TPA: hypothetical protein VF516_13705 [Kofleriaceae bacterium]